MIPEDLKYVNSHEWVKDNGDGTVTIGITEHAQEALGDVVFVELPSPEKVLTQGDDFGVVESVKAASDLYSPISGEVAEVNDELESAPEIINEDPYGAGWMLKIKLADEAELDDLMDAKAYQAFIDAEA